MNAKGSALTDSKEERVVQEIVRRLTASFDPLKIFLLGSRARGQFTADSDYDLLVVIEESEIPIHARARTAFRALCGVGVSKDVLVLTREEFERGLRQTNSLASTALREGVLICGA